MLAEDAKVPAYADASQLCTVLVNLFLNANMNEERENEGRANRRGNQRQILVMRNS